MNACLSVDDSPIFRLATRWLMALLSCFSVTANAGLNTWTQIGPNGGYTCNATFDPVSPNILYAATASGFYRTTNSGETWQKPTLPASPAFSCPFDIAFDPRSPQKMYVATDIASVYVSGDQGASFTLSKPNALYRSSSLDLEVASDGTVYFSAGRDIYRSIDQGKSWTLRGTVPGSTQEDIRTIQADPVAPHVVYAVAYSSGLFRSDDGGANWVNLFVPVGAQNSYTSNFVLDQNNPARVWLATNGGVLKSDNRGMTWQATPLAATILDIDVHPTNSQIVYASGWGGELFRTTDDGASWIKLRSKSSQLGLTRLTIDPRDSTHLVLIGTGRILASNDAGSTWRIIDNGVFASYPRRFYSTSSGRIFVPVNDQGLFLLAPDGKSVNPLPPDSKLPLLAGSDPPVITKILGIPGQDERLLVLLSNNIVARTENYIGNWLAASTPPPADAVVADIAVSPRGFPTAYVATSKGIFRSADYGDHWIPSSGGLPSEAQVTAVATTIDPNLLFSAVRSSDAPNSKATVYKSIDSGFNWIPTTLSGEAPQFQVSPFDSRTVFVSSTFLGGVNNVYYKSTDGGANWTTLSIMLSPSGCCIRDFVFDPANPLIVYGFGSATAYRSVDGGESFQRMTGSFESLGTYGPGSISVNPARPNQIFAAVDGWGVMEITIEPDLELSPQATSSVLPGSPLTIPITVTNKSFIGATNVRVEAQLSGQFADLRASTSAGSCTTSASSVTCIFAAVQGGSSSVVQLQMSATNSGSIQVTANASSDLPDAISSNNSAVASVAVKEQDSANKESGGGGVITIGMLLMLLATAATRTVDRDG